MDFELFCLVKEANTARLLRNDIVSHWKVNTRSASMVLNPGNTAPRIDFLEHCSDQELDPELSVPGRRLLMSDR